MSFPKTGVSGKITTRNSVSKKSIPAKNASERIERKEKKENYLMEENSVEASVEFIAFHSSTTIAIKRQKAGSDETKTIGNRLQTFWLEITPRPSRETTMHHAHMECTS